MNKRLSLLLLSSIIIQITLASNCFAAPIHDAVRVGDVHAVLRLLADEPKNRDFIYFHSNNSQRYRTPLQLAAGNGQTEVVLALLNAGAHVDTTVDGLIVTTVKSYEDCFSDDRPLFLAAQKGHPETVRLLLDRGATIRNSSIVGAINSGNGEIVRILFDHGYHYSRSLWLINFAAEAGYKEVVDELIARGASIYDVSFDRALYVAAEKGNTQIVTALIAAGAKFSEKGRLLFCGQPPKPAHTRAMRAVLKPEALTQLHLRTAAMHSAEGHPELAALSYALAAEMIRPKNPALADQYLAMGGDGDLYKEAARHKKVSSHLTSPPEDSTRMFSGLRLRRTGTHPWATGRITGREGEEEGLLAEMTTSSLTERIHGE